MKIVKLIGIFAVVVGIIYCAFNLKNWLGGDDGVRRHHTPQTYADCEKRVAEDWTDQSSWDKDLYDDTRNFLDMNKDDLGVDSYNRLLETLNGRVCVKLDSIMMNEFSKSNCSRQVINSTYAGVKHLKAKSPDFVRDPRIVKLDGTYTLYNNILGFGGRSFALSPGASVDQGIWPDFDSHASRIRATRDGYKRNQYFSNISNIHAVNNALAIDSRLNSARSNYRTAVANAIVRAFESRERTVENRNEYQRIQMKYNSSFGSSDIINRSVRNYLSN